ncbi:hypothetical protein T265_09875 [Opisthorchis viverrini]|uniref:Secreted protein n=1 Tax=Opisthorchis viverrini TaxID=6198 RepID=A0A074Z4B0_OPIVI|nr:hypothetical protein T265_09875 [Opisthorchis viverrini]KER21893.1 hypothetical protein T265_09875 [Opisthorchis viverrini]
MLHPSAALLLFLKIFGTRHEETGPYRRVAVYECAESSLGASLQAAASRNSVQFRRFVKFAINRKLDRCWMLSETPESKLFTEGTQTKIP